VTSPDGPALSEAVVAAAGGAAFALPPLPLKRLAAALERADVLVTGDTGLLHVGTAMGTPSVVLMGSAIPDTIAYPGRPQVLLFHREACGEWTEGVECRRGNTCQDRTCIEAITSEEARAGVAHLLDRRAGAAGRRIEPGHEK
jgi:ADP-heptose:LPS heptosyltransferase